MADLAKYDNPLPLSDGKYQYPFQYNTHGQLVPIMDFTDINDLIEQTIKLSETPEGQSYAYRRGSMGRPLMPSTSQDLEALHRPTNDVVNNTIRQSSMHMRALQAENRLGALEGSILFKPIYTMSGKLDIDEENLDNEKITQWMADNGALDLGMTNNPHGLAMSAVGHYESKQSVLRSMAIKELYGRDLTEDEVQQCTDAGLDNSAVMAVRDYVKNGKDFQKAFGLMERMTWANWVRYNRRFFDPASLASMAIEIGTDPLTFIPYGLAFKAPALISKTLQRATNSAIRQGGSGVTRSFANKGLKDFGVGAGIGGVQAYSYSSIRNWQGITEDTLSLTLGAMAFSGGLAFVGGRLSRGGILDANQNARISGKNLDDHARITGDIANEADVISTINRDLKSDKPTEIYGFDDVDRFQLNEINKLIDEKNKLLTERELYLQEGLIDEVDDLKLLSDIAEIDRRINALDDAYAARARDARLLTGETILKAENAENLRASLPERETDLRLATNEQLSTFQKKYKSLISKIPSLTFAGTIAKDARDFVASYASRLMPNESGWTAIDAKGNIVSATRLGKNLKDVNDHIRNQVTHYLDEYEKGLKELASTGSYTISEAQDAIHKALITPPELQPKLDHRLLKVMKPIQNVTKILGDMAEDQKKVFGDGFISALNELGEQQLREIEPLIQTLSHDKMHFIPAVVDEVKHHKAILKIAETIEGYGSDNIALHNAAIKQAQRLATDEAMTNLWAGVKNAPPLFQKFKNDLNRWWDIQKSKNPEFLSPVDEALQALKKEGITMKEREALGAGDTTLGFTADEQVANKVYDRLLVEESERVATGMINQHFETKHASLGEHGFDRPDHTKHRGSYWNYNFKAIPDTFSIGEVLDSRVNIVTGNYINQMSGRLAGNEIFGAKTFREAMDSHSRWVSDNFQYERAGDLSKADQKLLKSFEGIIRGNYGISVRGQDYLGGSGMHAGGVEAILEIFKNFTALTKSGFFWFYNMFETGAGVHAYGADFVLKGNPLMQNKLTRAIAGEKPNTPEIRFVQNQMCADELMSLNSWNKILENTKLKYGQNSLWGKLVAGSEYLYQHSPLTKMQRASQLAPEHLALNELTTEMIRFAHSNDYELGKKKWGGGFINETDIKRMGISSDRLNGLMSNLKKASYIDNENAPRVKTDIFDSTLTPRDKATISIMSNYIRDEVIQRSSFLDDFLFKGSSSSDFWKILTQFKSFSMNSFRKKLVKSANRVVYEGAYSETGIQFLLNAGLGTAMSQLKTLMRYNMLSDDEAKERFLELNYGVKSFDELDFSSLEPWMRASYNGIMDSAWFAGIQMAASYFDARSMMQRTSGGNLTSALQTKEGQSPAMKKFSNILTQNIPMLGKADELTSSANILLNYIWSPSKASDIQNTRKDTQKFLKAFAPNEPFIIAPILNALGGKYD